MMHAAKELDTDLTYVKKWGKYVRDLKNLADQVKVARVLENQAVHILGTGGIMENLDNLIMEISAQLLIKMKDAFEPAAFPLFYIERPNGHSERIVVETKNYPDAVSKSFTNVYYVASQENIDKLVDAMIYELTYHSRKDTLYLYVPLLVRDIPYDDNPNPWITGKEKPYLQHGLRYRGNIVK